MRNQIHELSIDDLDEVSGGNGPSLDIHNCWSYPRPGSGFHFNGDPDPGFSPGSVVPGGPVFPLAPGSLKGV
jgi:hypothetical protein